MSPSTEYLKLYHSRGIAIFMNIIYFFNLNLLTDHFSNYVTALIFVRIIIDITNANHVRCSLILYEWNSIYNKYDN